VGAVSTFTLSSAPEASKRSQKDLASSVEANSKLGMTRYEDPPFEPRSSCMALVRAPDIGALDDVVVARADTLEALATAEAIAAEAFGMRAGEPRNAAATAAPSARRRGVYRALVAERWREAVARDTPALTVQAGAMSRPILEKLGFITVAEVTSRAYRIVLARDREP
jgi:hypothetical protein